MTSQIVKKFEETVYKALSHYSKKNNVDISETGICLSLDDDKDIIYTVLLATKDDNKITGFNKIEQIQFTSGILLKKVDFTGQSIYVPLFIKQVMGSIAATHECEPTEIVVNIFPKDGKAIIFHNTGDGKITSAPSDSLNIVWVKRTGGEESAPVKDEEGNWFTDILSYFS